MATDGVRLAHHREHAIGGKVEHLVAEYMTVFVVELLEVVQVQEEQGKPGAVAPGVGDGQ